MVNYEDETDTACPKCGENLREAGGGSGYQDNGYDVDWTHYVCDSCGHQETDI